MTQIKTWEITDGKLEPVGSQLADHGRTEFEHLERWLMSEPEIIGEDITIIGRQVYTRSGPLDLLGIDDDGNTVIIELKRDRLARDALAQAIDYAADIARWDMERLTEEALKYTGETLEDFLSDTLEEGVLEGLSVNQTQRILLVGFTIDASLNRMVEWLTNNYGVSINAVILHYVRTRDGSELLSRTTTVPEEVEKQKTTGRRFKVPMSDEPGSHPDDQLRERLELYFAKDLVTPARIKRVLLPECLNHGVVTREQLKKAFVDYDEPDAEYAGYFVSLISNQLGMEKNDFLRQIIAYDYPNYPWEKDNYRIREGYEGLVRELVRDESGDETIGKSPRVAE